MKKKLLILLLIVISAIFLTGCETKITVRNAERSDVITMFKDYVGMHGFKLKYQNDKTGTYNVDMGIVFISGSKSTTINKSVVEQPANANQPMTRFEQTTWDSVNNPARYVNAPAAVSINKRMNDVIIIINTNTSGASLNDLKDYIKSLGYQVD